MDFKEYTRHALSTYETLGTLEDDNIHMMLGMFTEIGELADQVKKNHAYNREVDWTNVREELGDLMWYIAVFSYINGLDMGTTLNVNAKKLEQRYGGRFSKERAVNRDLSKEREVLENGN